MKSIKQIALIAPILFLLFVTSSTDAATVGSYSITETDCCGHDWSGTGYGTLDDAGILTFDSLINQDWMGQLSQYKAITYMSGFFGDGIFRVVTTYRKYTDCVGACPELANPDWMHMTSYFQSNTPNQLLAYGLALYENYARIYPYVVAKLRVLRDRPNYRVCTITQYRLVIWFKLARHRLHGISQIQ
jgi:hypothetical protein